MASAKNIQERRISAICSGLKILNTLVIGASWYSSPQYTTKTL